MKNPVVQLIGKGKRLRQSRHRRVGVHQHVVEPGTYLGDGLPVARRGAQLQDVAERTQPQRPRRHVIDHLHQRNQLKAQRPPPERKSLHHQHIGRIRAHPLQQLLAPARLEILGNRPPVLPQQRAEIPRRDLDRGQLKEFVLAVFGAFPGAGGHPAGNQRNPMTGVGKGGRQHPHPHQMAGPQQVLNIQMDAQAVRRSVQSTRPTNAGGWGVFTHSLIKIIHFPGPSPR